MLRLMPMMHRHQLAPSGVKWRTALARLVQPLTQKTNLLPPSDAPGNCSGAVSLLQAKTGWSTPHGGRSPEDGG